MIYKRSNIQLLGFRPLDNIYIYIINFISIIFDSELN